LKIFKESLKIKNDIDNISNSAALTVGPIVGIISAVFWSKCGLIEVRKRWLNNSLEFVKRIFMGVSIDEVHEEVKGIVREALSKENFAEDNVTRATKTVREHLHPLLSDKISSCYAAKMAEQTNQFIECCEEVERLKKEEVFFYQLKKQAMQVHTNVCKLQF
jgi:hypothetical protein